MSRWLLAAAVLLSLASSSLGAQISRDSSARRITRLQQRADSLARLWDEANALASLADSMAHGYKPSHLDTLAVGSLRIVSNSSALPLQAAAARAWPAIDSFYGPAAKTLESRSYLIHAFDPDSQNHQYQTWGTLIPWDKNEKELSDLLLVYVPMPPPDKAFNDWFSGAFLPSTRGMREDLERSYVALVTSHYGLGQECYRGEMASCHVLLNLNPNADPLQLFRTPRERQEAVRQMEAGYLEAEIRARLQGCNAGLDSICISMFNSLERSRLPEVVDRVTRQTLVRLALQLGGREAYLRLVADSTAPIATRLSATAGIPIDSLVQVWQTSVRSARPKPVALPGYGPAVGLGWVLVFGLCALRSSRWRVA